MSARELASEGSIGEYPLETRLRSFAAHLALGLGIAATAEAIWWLGRNEAATSKERDTT